MELKNTKTGAIVGLVVGILILVLTFIVPFVIKLNPAAWVVRDCKEAGCMTLLLITPIFYLIVGTIVGFVLDKLKSE